MRASVGALASVPGSDRADFAPMARHHGAQGLPFLLTAEEVANLLRTSRKAIYDMASRGQIPGVVRPNRRMLFSRDRVLKFIAESCVTFAGERSE